MRDMEDRTPGWILWHRQIIDKGYDAETYMIWSYLVLLAYHTECIIEGIKVGRGQFLTGRKSLSTMTKISESKIERILTFLQSEQQIEQQKTNKYRIVTIKNYDTYQIVNSKVNNSQQQPHSRPTTGNTYNQLNNTNNINNDKEEEAVAISKKEPDEWTKRYLERYGQ